MSQVKREAQKQAEIAFDGFILWSKRVTLWSCIFLAIVVVGCNSGVETGKGATGSKYNGEVYAPTNIGEDK